MSDVQIAVIDQQDTQIVLAVPGVQGATGSSIPSGGTTDQVLRKNSSTDYDANWAQVTSAMIANGTIVNDDINNSAAIAGTKISPDFGGQAVTTTGQVSAARVNVTNSTPPSNGIYLPSANNVAISTGGSGKLFVNNAGEVDVSSANARLYITTTGTNTAVATLRNASYYYNINLDGANGGLTFYNGTERLRITSAGLVGIGNILPDGLLTLAGANSNTPRFRIQHPSSDKDAAISTYFDGSGTYLLTGSNHYINSAGSNTKFDATSGSAAWYLDGSGIGIFYNSSGSGAISERLRITSNGTVNIVGAGSAGSTQAVSFNGSAPVDSLVLTSGGLLGIGTSSVNKRLEIAGNNDAVTENNTLRFTDTDVSTEADQQIGKIEFYSSDASTPGAGVKAYIGAFAADTTPDAYLAFATQDGSAVSTPVERVRITSDGKVGIGTAGPNAPLETAGANGTISIFRTNNATAANNAGGGFDAAASATASSRNAIMWLDADGANFAGSDYFYIQKNGNSGSVQLIQQSNAAMEFHTNGSPRAQIDSSGRLLVGTSTLRAVEPNGGSTSGATLTTHFEGISSLPASVGLIHNGTIAAEGSALYLARTRGTAVASSTLVALGDTLGTIAFAGGDGTDVRTKAAEIYAVVDGNPAYAATALVNGQTYRIVTVGTTDFTLIGASANTVGTVFTATGPGTGTGTAILNAGNMPGRLVFSTTADGASSPIEACRINSSQQLLVNTNASIASFNDGRIEVASKASQLAIVADATASSAIGIGIRGNTSTTAISFFNASDGATCGTIVLNSGGTSYNTSSDYRLKENVTPVTDGITRLQQLKPSRFNFIVNPDKTVDGFIAHEVQTIVPEAITGEKDAVDDEGNPQYQGIDQSKMVPLVVAALQECIKKVEALELELALLKSKP